MPIGIGKAVLIHEAIVFWFRVSGPSRGQGLRDERLHFRPALAGKTIQHLRESARIANLPWSEFPVLRMS